jgi:hypothetical protein
MSNNTFTVSVLFNAELFDTDGYHSTSSSTNRITIPTGLAGKYLVTASLSYAANSTGVRIIYINKTSGGVETTHGGVTTSNIGSVLNTSVATSTILDLAEGDYVTCEGYQNSGGSLNVASGTSSFFAVQYLGA